MKYPINEIFYSLQGEGLHTGKPMIFIRLAGCNMNCSFCDTKHEAKLEFSPLDILREVEIISYGQCQTILLTGGEPTIHNLQPLFDSLLSYAIHVESNATRTEYSEQLGNATWVTISPKSNTNLSKLAVSIADEIKFLVGLEDWMERIEFFLQKYHAMLHSKRLYVMPVDGPDVAKNTKMAIDFCKKNPRFSLCVQTHKLLNIQ